MSLGSAENLSNIELKEKIIFYLERFYCGIVEKTQSSGNLLIQFWAANIVLREKGRQYCELTTKNQLFYHDQSEDARLLSYRNHEVARSFRVCAGQEEEEEWQKLLGITGRVFMNKRIEVSPNISHYSTDEYPQREFALSCRIQASLCCLSLQLMIFLLTPMVSLSSSLLLRRTFIVSRRIYIIIIIILFTAHCRSISPLLQQMPEVNNILRSNIFSISIPPDVFNEIDHVLKVVSETFQVPLAQCWLSRDRSIGKGDYTVINQKSSLDYENLVPWCKFKEACSQLYLNMGDGLVGRTFMSHTPFFCSDITKLSIRSYPLAHYIGNCGSVDCFTMCLHNCKTGDKDYVMEFFLPHEEMDSHCPESLLTSLLETLGQHFKTFVLVSGEKLGQEMSVKVDTFLVHKSESFKIAYSNISFPRQKIQKPERSVFPLTPSAWKLLWSIDDNVFSVPCLSPLGSPKQLDQNDQVIEASGSSSNFSEGGCKRELSARTKINNNILTEEASPKYIEPQSLNYQFMDLLPQDEIVQDEEESIDDPSNLGLTSEDSIKHKEHIVRPEKVYRWVGESPVEDVRSAMTTKSQPLSFQTRETLPRQEGKEDTAVLDPSAQKLMLEDAHQIQNKGLILAIENADIDTQLVNKTCVEGTPNRENSCEESISFESLTKHFGRPLDDAAKSFGVSRSTFKRVCRGHGIKRWQSGKRRMAKYISSKLEGKLNEEEPSKRNFYCSSMAPVEDTAVVSHTSQDMNKMTVKATYNGVTIRFELSDSSGIAELQDNVIERLQVERKCFSIKYQDDEGDWILIACDKDVRECIEISRSLKKTTIKMDLDPPINHYAP